MGELKQGWTAGSSRTSRSATSTAAAIGRTVTQADNLVTLLTNNTNQIHFKALRRRRSSGRPLVNSAITLAIVAGSA